MKDHDKVNTAASADDEPAQTGRERPIAPPEADIENYIAKHVPPGGHYNAQKELKFLLDVAYQQGYDDCLKENVTVDLNSEDILSHASGGGSWRRVIMERINQLKKSPTQTD